MLFTSFVFLFVFLPVVLVGWWTLRRPLWRFAWLTLASYFFYAWWDWRFLPLLWLPTINDFLAGRAIAGSSDPRYRKFRLVLALCIDLTSFGIFKYSGFFLDSLNGIGSLVGLKSAFPGIEIVLPIGISFYTFNSMSYSIDVYRGRVPPTRSILRYACFLSMFPHLIAGPIVRYEDITWQLDRLERRLTAGLAAAGLFFLACGLGKKLLIADTLAPRVTELFAAHRHLELAGGWLAALTFALQLYFDFSGYSDMAVGLALLLGFRFPQNFDSPYKAVNISDFWRRWHMSLSFWFRDYLFIPLGGSRRGQARTLFNLLLTMFLAGLWHGAAWTYALWGLLHGGYLAGHAVLRDARLTPRWTWLNRAITFVCVLWAWVLFRAASLGEAVDVWKAMLGLRGVEAPQRVVHTFGASMLVFVAALLVFVNVAPNSWELKPRPLLRYGLAFGLIAGAAILTITRPSPFLYFQF